ncbi:GNAT family N-acetyltransferase [Fimbriiglobus ruber]|uniref:BioF2-like acetyltransferase domain-containing protein n=1 Tax=Fimbriiglobus ruber TaxID=1908690 RepID=A0A225DC50_9BACT|nr:GNAT family N-acetyltransferase [Fimbriiglobus ruber]OWK38563.1 hypothetical protein FRUB_07683 [Fimbriiglobus ruber]
MLRIERYTPGRAALWDAFVDRAKNGVFLFRRGYMDYHADRFTDHSLLFWEGDRLVAVLPANERDGTLASHGGLTFGGVVTDRRMRTGAMVDLVAGLRAYMPAAGLATLVYKAIPHIYHQAPAEEDLYALTAHGARLVRRDVASAIDLRDRVDPAKGRKWGANRARANGLAVAESTDYTAFMAVEEENLRTKYGTRPVHTAAELALLADRFPGNIRLFVAAKDDRLLGGVVVYQSRQVAHAQYIATTPEGRDLGCLDAVMDELLNRVYPGRVPYFDFGISTEKSGTYLNRGLIENKESYGGRAVVYDFYELPGGFPGDPDPVRGVA